MSKLQANRSCRIAGGIPVSLSDRPVARSGRSQRLRPQDCSMVDLALRRQEYLNRFIRAVDECEWQVVTKMALADNRLFDLISREQKAKTIRVLVQANSHQAKLGENLAWWLLGNEGKRIVRDCQISSLTEASQRAIIQILNSLRSDVDRGYVLSHSGLDYVIQESLCGEFRARFCELSHQHDVSARPGDWQGFFGFVEGLTQRQDEKGQLFTRKTSGNRLKYLADGYVWPVLKECYAKAICAQVTVFGFNTSPNDSKAREFQQLLQGVVERGGRAQLMLDEVGCGWSAKERDSLAGMVNEMRRHGVKVLVNDSWDHPSHINHQKIHVLTFAKGTKLEIPQPDASLLHYTTRWDHEQIGFCGGMNIGDHYFDEVKGWVDGYLMFMGPVTTELSRVNLEMRDREIAAHLESLDPDRVKVARQLVKDRISFDPLVTAEQHARKNRGREVYLIPHIGGNDRDIEECFVRAIATLKKGDVFNGRAPYCGSPRLIRAIKRAVERGATINFVIPKYIDVYASRVQSLWMADLLRRAGAIVKFYVGPKEKWEDEAHQGHMSHIKGFLIETAEGKSILMFGSSNWDARSLRINSELVTVTTDPKSCAAAKMHMFSFDDPNKRDWYQDQIEMGVPDALVGYAAWQANWLL